MREMLQRLTWLRWSRRWQSGEGRGGDGRIESERQREQVRLASLIDFRVFALRFPSFQDPPQRLGSENLPTSHIHLLVITFF